MRRAIQWLVILLFSAGWTSAFAPDPWTASPARIQETGESLYQEGYSAYQNKDYASARQRFQQAAQLFRQEKNNRGTAAALEGEARSALAESDYETAQSAGRDALQTAMYANAVWEQGQSYMTLGIALYMTGKPVEAASYLEIAKEKITLSANQIGMDLLKQWQEHIAQPESIQPPYPGPWTLQPVAGSSAEPPNPDVDSMLGKANVLLLSGELGQAANWCTQALQEVNAGRGSVDEMIKAIGCLSEINIRWGDNDKAFSYAYEALRVSTASGNPCQQAKAWNMLGNGYRAIGNLDQAASYYRQALFLAAGGACKQEWAMVLNNLGESELSNGKYQDAAAHLEQALQVYRELETTPLVSLMVSMNLGTVYRSMGEYQKALDIHTDILNKSTSRMMVIDAMYQIGVDELALKDITMASVHCASAWEGFAGQYDLNGQAFAAKCVGKTYEEEGKLAQALEWYQKAITAREKMVPGSQSESIQQAIHSKDLDFYEPAIQVQIALKDFSGAFALSEQARARNFLTMLGNKQFRPNRSESSPLAEQEFSLRQKMNDLQAQIRQESVHSGPGSDAIKKLQDQLDATFLVYHTISDELQINNPEYASLLRVTPFSVEDTQKLIQTKAPGLTIISYFVLADQVVAFVITGSQFHTQVLPVGLLELIDQENQLEDQMKSRALFTDGWKTPARQLYTRLINPVRPYLPPADPKHPAGVLIIPHLILHYLPFQLLLDGDVPFFEQFRISYAPSVSSLQFLGKKTTDAPSELLAMANPQSEGQPTLRNAATEAEAIASLFQTQAVVGDRATETLFKAQASQFRILHIAAHSDLNTQMPLFSSILLQKDAENDGRLQVMEIFDLDLSNTDLVVLSACDTHMVALSPGDEIFGLERAFFRAGAHNLLTSMWSVDDEATAILMNTFYKQLRQGTPKAEALRAAQLDMIQKGYHPYYWAGFSFAGLDAEKPTLKSLILKNPGFYWLIVPVILVVFLLISWRRRRQEDRFA